jgi:hypothetical protein
MVDKFALGQFLSRVPLFSPFSIISPKFRTHASFAYNRRYVILSFYVVFKWNVCVCHVYDSQCWSRSLSDVAVSVPVLLLEETVQLTVI